MAKPKDVQGQEHLTWIILVKVYKKKINKILMNLERPNLESRFRPVRQSASYR